MVQDDIPQIQIVEQTVSAENPPPYEDEKQPSTTRYAKIVDEEELVRTNTADTDKSFYYENGKFYWSNGEPVDGAGKDVVGTPLVCSLKLRTKITLTTNRAGSKGRDLGRCIWALEGEETRGEGERWLLRKEIELLLDEAW